MCLEAEISMCDHNGYYTPASRYDRYRRELRFVLVCDDCEAVLDELTRLSYTPVFNPFFDDDPSQCQTP
jgi:hypothetical protein